MLFRPARPQLLGQLRSLATVISLTVGASQVVFEFADGFLNGFLRIRGRRCDVTQVHQLFESLG